MTFLPIGLYLGIFMVYEGTTTLRPEVDSLVWKFSPESFIAAVAGLYHDLHFITARSQKSSSRENPAL